MKTKRNLQAQRSLVCCCVRKAINYEYVLPAVSQKISQRKVPSNGRNDRQQCLLTKQIERFVCYEHYNELKTLTGGQKLWKCLAFYAYCGTNRKISFPASQPVSKMFSRIFYRPTTDRLGLLQTNRQTDKCATNQPINNQPT